jgi:hypothetical protein
VIALRGIYSDDCKRQQIRWSLAETWSRLSIHRDVYMIVHIHVTKEGGRSQNLLARRVLLQIHSISYDEPYHEKEQMAPPIVRQAVLTKYHSQKELEFRGSQPSRYSREE